MKTRALDRQSILDIALQAGGGIEAAIEIATRHDTGISEDIDPGLEIEATTVANALVLERYTARNARPATGISTADRETLPYGGIGYMGIEMDFIVS